MLPAGVDGAELRFWQWYEIEGNGYDGGNLKVAVDGGAFSLVTPVPAYNDSSVNGLGGAPGYNGSAGWHEVVVDLSSFAGHSVQVRWTLGTDDSQVRRGWYLADLSVIVWGGEVGPPLFVDDFEDGTTDAWSTVAG